MGINFFRFVLIIIFAGGGYFIGCQIDKTDNIISLIGLGVGFTLAIFVILLEKNFVRVSHRVILGGLLGFILGLFIANLLIFTFSSLNITNPLLNKVIPIFFSTVFGYIGLVLGIKKSKELEMTGFKKMFQTGIDEENIKILDTSVIIDGRIADIAETSFLEGVLMIPQFVLNELQQIADSPDSLKRNRGRRGLDILQKMQKNVDINLKIIDQDFPKIKEVDAKLVALGKMLGGKVITNDFNLNKVAELQGVTVLNINQLANALKPVVLPGEVMNVYILKEGKEYGQGVAYLDDGTMVVVDNAKRHIGQNLEVLVTSVLQTTAGRMIFTKPKEEVTKEEVV
ncbi:MAG TPA: PIN domain-containing protein [Nitrospinota bacterium]|nr:PIN domain-containing protein [Nitrospinota bacterium]